MTDMMHAIQTNDRVYVKRKFTDVLPGTRIFVRDQDIVKILL